MVGERDAPTRRRRHIEREQLDLSRALAGDLAPRDALDLTAQPFFSLIANPGVSCQQTSAPASSAFASKLCRNTAWR